MKKIRGCYMKLELFYFESCPFCQKVLQFLADKNHCIKFKDIHTVDKYREELNRITGKAQVPCLVIDGKPMLESDDIIVFLKKNISEY
jgi:glutaredoxin 3